MAGIMAEILWKVVLNTMTLIPLLLHSLDKFLENKREKVNISENGNRHSGTIVILCNNDKQ
jgi:hypothetical protein